MIPEEKKYERLINILRKSKPVLENTDDIEERVIERIHRMRQKGKGFFTLFDYLFGWVYIGWVRKSLIAVSVLIVVLFAYQQTVILKQISILSSQVVVTGDRGSDRVTNDLEQKLLFYKISGRKIKTARPEITGKQIEELLESVNELQTKYKDLIKLIEDDPDLKKEIEKKLMEKNGKKFNL
jgi:hypothetical protein